jgi:hypothetical protein
MATEVANILQRNLFLLENLTVARKHQLKDPPTRVAIFCSTT